MHKIKHDSILRGDIMARSKNAGSRILTFRTRGDLDELSKKLEREKNLNLESILRKYGEVGVSRLKIATPKRTGTTANSWEYKVVVGKGVARLVFSNTNVNNGVNIAIILQYGHGKRNGGYIKGIDYINPALKPVFEDLKEACWKEVVQ